MLGLLAWAGLPDTSHAQRWGGGRGWGGSGVYIGTGYGGYGSGGYGYNRGYYGSGYGYGGSYGPGYYRPGFGAGLLVGSALSNGGYYSGGNYYSNGGYSNGGVVYSQPSSSYQSFYDGGMSSGGYVSSGYASNDCCCSGAMPSSSAGYSTGTVQSQNGYSTVVVDNLPANAEVYWNGVRTSPNVRRFAAIPQGNDGSVQKFEARWIGPDGKMVTQSREIRAQANQTVNLDWNNATNDRGEEATAPNSSSQSTNPNSNSNSNSNPNANTNPNSNPNSNPNTTNPNPNKGDR